MRTLAAVVLALASGYLGGYMAQLRVWSREKSRFQKELSDLTKDLQTAIDDSCQRLARVLSENTVSDEGKPETCWELTIEKPEQMPAASQRPVVVAPGTDRSRLAVLAKELDKGLAEVELMIKFGRSLS